MLCLQLNILQAVIWGGQGEAELPQNVGEDKPHFLSACITDSFKQDLSTRLDLKSLNQSVLVSTPKSSKKGAQLMLLFTQLPVHKTHAG